MEIKVDLAKLRPLQQNQSPEPILLADPIRITSLSDLAPYIEGLSDLNVNELDEAERAAFWKSLRRFGFTLTEQLNSRLDFPSELEIIRRAADRITQEPDFFTGRYLRAGVLEQVTKEICDGRDRSRPLWKLASNHEIVCSSYRDELGKQFVERIEAHFQSPRIAAI